MDCLKFLSAGESHGPALSIILDGLPSGIEILPEDINKNLNRRQKGYGRGKRMLIETDKAEIIGGIRNGLTLGGPISLLIKNKDYENWQKIMNPVKEENSEELIQEKYISGVRPGHADFSGAIKYNQQDIRNILERSSARETASRVAAGSIALKFLKLLGIEIRSHVVQIADIKINEKFLHLSNIKDFKIVEDNDLRCLDEDASNKMRKLIDYAKENGETLGGKVQIVAFNVPIGLGSHTQWDRKLDAMLAHALISIQAAKAVSFGIGEINAELLGSQIHDQMQINPCFNPQPPERGLTIQVPFSGDLGVRYEHITNNAGGIEGGMSNGEPIVCNVSFKPIPTLPRDKNNALKSIDLGKKENMPSFYERSDICVVPAAGVVCESMIALVLADQIIKKFGSDSLIELRNNFYSYLEYCKNR